MKTSNKDVLTYRFNTKLMAEIETLRSELLARFRTGKSPDQLLQVLMQKQHALEHGKSISRGKAIAKQQREFNNLNPAGA